MVRIQGIGPNNGQNTKNCGCDDNDLDLTGQSQEEIREKDSVLFGIVRRGEFRTRWIGIIHMFMC